MLEVEFTQAETGARAGEASVGRGPPNYTMRHSAKIPLPHCGRLLWELA